MNLRRIFKVFWAEVGRYCTFFGKSTKKLLVILRALVRVDFLERFLFFRLIITTLQEMHLINLDFLTFICIWAWDDLTILLC